MQKPTFPLLRQTLQLCSVTEHSQSSTVHTQRPCRHWEFAPQLPPTQPPQVAVPHSQRGSGLPPTQVPLQSMVPPQLLEPSQVSP